MSFILENYNIFYFKGSGGEAPGRWRIFDKINENSNEKFKKFEFFEGKFQYYLVLKGSGAKPPDIGEFLRK